jgi:hypothetical protein
MVAKPSIFSSDYQRKMKRRKMRNSILILAIFFVAGGAVIVNKGYFSKNTQNIKETQKTQTQSATNTIEKPIQETTATKEEGFEFKLSDGKTLKAVYEVSGTEKKFKYVSPVESKVYYDVSPSGKNMVVFDGANQSIKLIDLNGNIQDITNLIYKTTSGTKINRDNVLKTNAKYIWCQSPKFIDDNTVAYISQLPWLNKTPKYIWKVNINTKVHNLVKGIQGNDVKFISLESKGLKLIVDGKTVYIKPDGSVSK